MMMMMLLLFIIVVIGGVFTIIGTVALCARCRSILKQRYRRRECGDESDDELVGDGGKLTLLKLLVCTQRRTVKSISTATQVTSLEIAHKLWNDAVNEEIETAFAEYKKNHAELKVADESEEAGELTWSLMAPRTDKVDAEVNVSTTCTDCVNDNNAQQPAAAAAADIENDTRETTAAASDASGTNRIDEREATVIAEPSVSSVTEISRPKKLSLSGTTNTPEGLQAVWNQSRRFSVDVLPVSQDRRPSIQQQQTSGRGRVPTRTTRLPTVTQRRTSQPTVVQARRPSDNVSTRHAARRFSDNDGATCSGGRERWQNVETSATTSASTSATSTLARPWTNTQSTSYPRRQSVQSNPSATVRDRRSTVRRSSEGRENALQVDTWWTRSARRPSRDRQTEQLEQTDRPLPPWVHYQKRRSAPEVAYTRSYRRASTSSSRHTTGDSQLTELRELPQSDRNEMARRQRWNAAVMRHGEDSFDSVLTSRPPSPTESMGSDYSSAGSLSDIARGHRKDSGFRSIETQSSYSASRKSSTTSGPRRQSFQSFQTTDTSTGRHNSIPFVANPFELTGRFLYRPASNAPRSSGRRQSMFTKSDEVGGGESDWLKEWLRWRAGCSDGNDVETPDLGPQSTSNRHTTGVLNSLSDKVERTFEGFDRVLSRATALIHDRRMSTPDESHTEC